jgi:hypothetical protein
MTHQPTLSMIHDPGAEARDRYRWILLAGWFVLISTVFSSVIAMPPRVEPASVILLALAALALAIYNIVIKRYWAIALGLVVAFIAVTAWTVVR